MTVATEAEANINAKRVALSPSWLQRLEDIFNTDAMQQLGVFLRAEKKAGKQIYPPSAHIFNALDSTPFDEVAVVILGQDPYHGPGQAHGLSFSVPEGIKPPPSLVNIGKELCSDLGIERSASGCLTQWAEQGVLLLNAVLTVEHKSAGSHAGRGWEQFTDRVIDELNRGRDGLVFMLWGSYAQKKGALIDRRRHLVLEAPHPSPLSAHRGFFGCRHFSLANQYLEDNGLTPIDWSIT